ncbi:hypothetical protein [Ktedonobacter robiniae]|uniref:Resolvase HTH domain-containing protein n=1 Tax=Ktedonobacter robiniae TaxID=2778365 RepID=A0ABQ3UXL8_9CHLR|nr:hypothetical protein [Ktedonobacter robiniae]GHO57621.1 hypothetical protein KSB_60960 [Ktedonobacter robiniae]
MEEQEERGYEQTQVAKAHLVLLMQAGYSWHKAAVTARLRISQSTAYRLVIASVSAIARNSANCYVP